MGQEKIGREDLEQAHGLFLEAGQLFQRIEQSDGTGHAVLGRAQITLGQASWDEAINTSGAAVTHFTHGGDSIGQADALLTLGLAYRDKEDFEQALFNFEKALKLYHQQQ